MTDLEPFLNPGTFVYVSLRSGLSIDPEFVIASIKEPEGLSVIMSEHDAHRHNLEPMFRCAWITLSVQTDLAAIGLTATFAAALGDAGISCNVVAGAYHDHIFVPVELAEKAMNELHSVRLSRHA